MNLFLKRPVHKAYIITHSHTQAIYGIDAARKTIVAFKSKEQAHTFKRLLTDVEKRKCLKVDNMNLDFLKSTCSVSGLDLIVYEHDCSFLKHTAYDTVNENVRFEFECRYRFGA